MKSIKCTFGKHDYKVVNQEELETPPNTNNINSATLTSVFTMFLLPFIIKYECTRCGKMKDGM